MRNYCPPWMKLHAPAAARNSRAIADVLSRLLSGRGTVLEIASGTGQHVVEFARSLPAITWQPSDLDPEHLASIEAYRLEAGLDNVRPPVRLDAESDSWPVSECSAVVCSNMIHIAPWSVCEGLFRGAARVLSAGEPLILYGPFRFQGRFTAPSNAEFDRSLRARDPGWGVRDVDHLDALAEEHGLGREEAVAMPANNHVLVFRSLGAPPTV